MPEQPTIYPPPLPLSPPQKTECLIDDAGDETRISYKGEPSIERYKFIRDYLEFRIRRLKEKAEAPENALVDALASPPAQDTADD